MAPSGYWKISRVAPECCSCSARWGNGIFQRGRVAIARPFQNLMKRITPDLTGQTFGRLTAIRREPGRDVLWHCLCTCGAAVIVFGSNLRRGRTHSCGCWMRDRLRLVTTTTHGHTVGGKHSPEYISFTQARVRCTNPKQDGYEYYGGRGIEFRFISFEQFLEHIGPRPTKQHTLDRKDSNGHYEPGNVRWATWEEQAANKRSRKGELAAK